jgi:hypothetical protein
MEYVMSTVFWDVLHAVQWKFIDVSEELFASISMDEG